MTTEPKYCTKCGAAIPSSAGFCPECGASQDTGDSSSRIEYTAAPASQKKKGDLGVLPIIMIVYGILAVVAAIFIISMGMAIDSVLAMLKEMVDSGQISQSDYDQYVQILSVFAITANKMSATAVGIAMALSGIFSVIAGMKADKMESWKITLALTLVAVLILMFAAPFMPVLSIILMILGLIVTFFIYRAKDQFIS
jgi:uncharacterized membrane protein HdeD (DUF308 family)